MRVLIANRGEIAVRIERTLRDIGFESVAIFSEPDRKALHVINADYALEIGGDTPQTSYLDIGKILWVVRKSRAEMVHPGYGFLSERPEFAYEIEKHGVIFIGPDSEAMRLAGDKVEARKIAARAGIPLLEGTDALDDLKTALDLAKTVGYPLMIKAAAGGGGKGMRVVKNEEELKELFPLASAEALSAFGDGRLYLERLVLNPHHIEVQIIADKHGNVFALGERECSLQRRHQKFIEESPSPTIDDKTRKEIMEAAKAFAREIGYTNAGTVEFLYDEDRGKFYFLEMNARLQVEHPVTEMRTNLDLVELQIKVALGERLKLDDLSFNGHSIEARVNAEDPYEDFVPSSGKIEFLREPSGPFIRVDSGIYEGYEVPIFYDPILSKVISFGRTREEARRRLLRALGEYTIFGIRTNIPYLIEVLESEAFVSGKYTTNFSKTFEFVPQYPDYLAKLSALYEPPKVTHNVSRNRANTWKLFKDYSEF
ncbi:acetyl/propionyl-CoA carboxylase, alpha subunit [Thiovulum sp. ES]|nr:acetyl/propionyl-CoA carboxylase, alpha subunit [Thiovulum sp. ES]